jgi:UDP-N-acetylglucosamine--N-acetylmuramyl-(pentapeptide) pyrophosphoryl-undecaprenol N-acetylglucosamine transferase
MKQSVNILLSGGGTGGHIFPAISIANEIKLRFPYAKFLFVGAKDRMEMERVPKAGFEIVGLDITGIKRSFSIDNLLFPLKLFRSIRAAKGIVKAFKPDVVIGTGGFASGPTLYVAAQSRIPSVIQEQNSYPGITNKLLAKKAVKICVAYDGLEQFFPKEKIVKTGNPVRQDLLEIDSKRGEALKFFGLEKNKKTLVILGGSLGSGRINEAVEKDLTALLGLDLQIIWQTGKYYYKKYAPLEKKSDVQILDFVQRMDLIYAAADLIISRAGAGTISELCLVGKPVIFIPSPNVAEDHQTKNAMAVVQKEAAILLRETELDQLVQVVGYLKNNEEMQKKFKKNIKSLALPDATKDIVDEVMRLIE